MGLSAQAEQICPKGYTDAFGGTDVIDDKLYITYNGNRHDCVEVSDVIALSNPQARYDCGGGRRGSSNYMFIPSKEGVIYQFSGFNPNKSKRIDCSSGSHCLVETLSNNLASPSEPQIKFNILISNIYTLKVKCNKLSF